MCVEVHKFPHGGKPLLGGLPANKDSIGSFQVLHRGSLGKELRVRQHLKLGTVVAGCVKDSLDGLRGTHWDGRLFNHDLVRVRDLGNLPGTTLHKTKVRRTTGANTISLRGCVHADKDDIRFTDRIIDIR